MKLAELDVHGTGRVKLADFYRSSKEKGTWQFLETPEYLQHVGALDTSSEWLGPQVIIPNYVTGMNNCISSSAYYDVCCLNECDAIFQHLEARIQAPTANAAEITRAIEEGITLHPLLSSTAPTEPRNLTKSLRDMLAQTAEIHDGMIPLHGRLFAQWLHYAFPHECPYPHVSKGFNPLTSSEWFAQNGKDSVASADEVQKYSGGVADTAEEESHYMSQWTLEEELRAGGKAPLREEPEVSTPRSFIGSFFSFLMKIAMFAAVGMALYRTWRSMADSAQVPFLSKKKVHKLDHLL